ncbi:MAG: nucleoside hydrolase [Christensenellales bacterium]|jgi:inosine-uridine nucleoside N-ribohydrolase
MLTQLQRLKMLKPPKEPIDMVLDTDTYNEIDDQYAISYAMASTDRLNLKALYAAPFDNKYVSGPAEGMERSYQEIHNLFNLMGKEVPVYRGSEAYLTDENTPVESPAMRDLVERAMQYTWENPLYVVGIAAITNIASAMLVKPEISGRIVVVWLGGHTLGWPGNAEFNLRQDVAAARVVFGSGAPLVLLPCLGVVHSFITTEPELNYWLRGKNALCDYLIDHTVEVANEYACGKVWSRPLWDVTAIGWLTNDQNRFMLDKLIHTPIPEYDHHYAEDPRRPLCRMVYYINRDALMGDLFDRISRL